MKNLGAKSNHQILGAVKRSERHRNLPGQTPTRRVFQLTCQYNCTTISRSTRIQNIWSMDKDRKKSWPSLLTDNSILAHAERFVNNASVLVSLPESHRSEVLSITILKSLIQSTKVPSAKKIYLKYPYPIYREFPLICFKAYANSTVFTHLAAPRPEDKLACNWDLF